MESSIYFASRLAAQQRREHTEREKRARDIHVIDSGNPPYPSNVFGLSGT
jgi:hypothetical protein